MPLVSNAPHMEVTYRIIGAAMEIHSKLGPAHPEEVYQKALELKLPEAGLSFEAQRPVEVFLDGTALSLYYLDFLVEEQVIVNPLGIGLTPEGNLPLKSNTTAVRRATLAAKRAYHGEPVTYAYSEEE